MRDGRGDVVYVGKAQSLKHRVRSYWQKGRRAAAEGHRIRRSSTGSSTSSTP
jgi:excinuclease UvrABC nuclease subunit